MRKTWTMLPSNFDSLATERPDLAGTFHRITAWVRTHPDWNLIDPRELGRQLRDEDPIALTVALRMLVLSGLFRQVYVVVTPSGVLAEGEYEDPRQIPTVARDRFDQPFDTSEADIIPVLTQAV